MKKFLKLLPKILLLIFIFLIYRNWFFPGDVIGGDWPYYFPQALSNLSFPPPSWVSWRGNGFGGIDITYSLHIFEHITMLGATLFNIPWYIVTKITWFLAFLLVSLFSIHYLYKVILPKSGAWQKAIAGFFYLANTYILLVASGGQMGYALGYAISPLGVGLFIKCFSLTDKSSIIKNIILTSLVFGFLLMVDIRIAYMVIFVVTLYFIYMLLHSKTKRITTLIIFLTPILFAGLLNLSWILPLILLNQNIVSEVSQTYSSVDSLHFFSFADFSHALGLLHPNWPENIFGKVYFMRSEFLILPLLAFSSLLFVNKDLQSRNILFFSLIGLIGAFLAKGANDPLGGIYIWFFEHIPGFVMFRDPTKWYLLVALAYSILIPFSVWNIYNWLSSKFKVQNSKLQFKIKNYISICFFLLTPFLLLILVWPALVGQLGGTFHKHVVPQEYFVLTEYLDNQSVFFRTLWLPRSSRFTYSDSVHPVVEGLFYYNTNSSTQFIKQLNKSNTQQQLEYDGIKYIIIPYDNLGEIFQEDRKYNPKEYEYLIHELRKISWLHEIKGFGNIIVFQTPSHKDHFFLTNEGHISYTSKNTTEYMLRIDSETKNTVIFTEKYNPYWRAEINHNSVYPVITKEGYMQFVVPENGSFSLSIIFTQQYYYLFGFVVSTIILTLLVGIFVVLQYTNFFQYLKNTI